MNLGTESPWHAREPKRNISPPACVMTYALNGIGGGFSFQGLDDLLLETLLYFLDIHFIKVTDMFVCDLLDEILGGNAKASKLTFIIRKHFAITMLVPFMET